MMQKRLCARTVTISRLPGAPSWTRRFVWQTMDETSSRLQVVFKVASRCNLNCAYCYVYNKGDDSWRSRPAFMSDAVLGHTIDRIRGHVERSRQRDVRI